MSSEKQTPQEIGREAYVGSVRELRDSAPKVIINVGIAILIWLIGNYVFIPISAGLFVQSFAVTQLVSVTILLALALLVVGIFREIKDLSDAAAGFVAYTTGTYGSATTEELKDYKTAFRGILYVLVVAAAFLLFAQQLNLIHPALAAITLLAITVWTVLTVIRSGRALSKIVERYAKDWAAKLEAQLKGEKINED